jgi:hypothetical protein
MIYNVKFPTREQSTLADLIGKPLRAIATNGWSVELQVEEQIFRIVPEEVPTPDEAHSVGDVDRPKVEVVSRLTLDDRDDIVADHLGRIQAIHLISVLISFSPPQSGPAITLPSGAVIPPGIDYGWIYYNPWQKQAVIDQLDNSQALIDLDIGLELVTEKYLGVILYTLGHFVQVSLNGLPEGIDWVQLQRFSRRPLPNTSGT